MQHRILNGNISEDLEILKAVNIDVESKEEAQKIAVDLYDSMLHGVGIAAPQIGINKRIFLIKTPELNEVYVNPVIKSATGKIKHMEGCLSFPAEKYEIKRKAWVEISYLDINFELKEKILIGMEACIFQHEFDHLNGVLIKDI